MKKISADELDLLAHEWHPTKNEVSFHEVIPGSSKMVWWLSPECGHEWETKMFARAVRGAACPICNNRQLLTGFNDIATVHPDWVPFWSPSNGLPAQEVIAGGKPEYAWLCEEGHEFFSSVGHKERGRGCPYCSHMKVLPGFNDLATKHPELTSEWHPTKNGGLTPENVIAGGRSKHWWLGSCGHEWETHVRRRVEGAGCHVCAGQKVVAGVNDLASQAPHIAIELHPSKNGGIEASTIMVRSTQPFWWKCDKGHEWEAKVSHRTVSNNGCNLCKQDTRKYSFKAQSLKSFPQLVEEWHFEKNGELRPEMMATRSHVKVWWLGACKHEWEATVGSRTSKNPTGCPQCSGLKVTVGVNDLVTKKPALSQEWHPTKNQELQPSEILWASNKKVWWLCPQNHSYEMSVAKRSTSDRNCPICSGHKVIAGINDLATKHPNLAAEWHPTKNGALTPDKIPASGGRGKAWWQCSTNPQHEWEASISGRARVGRGCPQCWATSYISKAEQNIYEYLTQLLPDTIIHQSDKKVLKGKELDILIPEKKFAVEFNGLFWHSENAGKNETYHYTKWLNSKAQGIQLVQIWEDDWARNPELVKRLLAHKLGVSQQQKVFARKTSVSTITKTEAELFLNQNHIQGYSSGSYYVALKHDDKVVALLVLRKEGGENEGMLNIIRYATSVNVVGGFTKLLKYVEKTYEPEGFITFADHMVSDGGLYENNGFIADKILPPEYMYVVGNERKHKFGYRLKRFQNDPELLWEEGLTERELAALNGLERVWDAGKTRYRKIV